MAIFSVFAVAGGAEAKECCERYTEVRTVREPHPQTIKAHYIFYFCGSDVPRLFERGAGEDDASKYPIHLALPKGLPSPEGQDFAEQGNVYKLTGYRYKTIARDVYTGAVIVRRSPRMDVIRWRVLAPWFHYAEKRNADGTGSGKWARKKERVSVERRFEGSDHSPHLFILGDYRKCW